MRNNNFTTSEIKSFKSNYSDRGFWNRLVGHAKSAGKTVVKFSLVIFYLLIDEEASLLLKAFIIGAFGYAFLTFDLIPDWITVIGSFDDISILWLAFECAMANASPLVLERAETKFGQWFEAAA